MCIRDRDLLTEKRHELNELASMLLEKEVLLKSDVERLIGKRPVPDDELAILNREVRM